MNKILIFIIGCILTIACRNGRQLNNDSPNFWVKHETVEFKVKFLDARFEGGDVDFPYFVKSINGHDAILFFVGHVGNSHWVLYDLQAREWTRILSFVDPTPYRERVEDRNANRVEDEKKYVIEKRKYEAEVERLITPILERSKRYYRDFPERWSHPAGDRITRVRPPEAAFFDYMKDGGYAVEYRKGGGGWWGGEKQTVRKYEQFTGTKTMFFKGHPVFQVQDEMMNDHTYVLDNFRTVVYKHRSTDSIKLDIMDLTELWAAQEEPSPKIWTRHETIEYKLSNLYPKELFKEFSGSPYRFLFYVKLKNGHDALCCNLRMEFLGTEDEHWVLYDFQTKKWKVLLSFLNPGQDDTSTLAYDKARAKFLEESRRIIDPLLKRPDQHDDLPFLITPPPQGQDFNYKIEKKAVYPAPPEAQRGWWGSSSQPKQKEPPSVSSVTTYAKGQPVFQVGDDRMGEHTFVLNDLSRVFYLRQTRDSLCIDIMDLTNQWEDEVKADGKRAADRPGPAAGSR